jgi:hypothetical protein
LNTSRRNALVGLISIAWLLLSTCASAEQYVCTYEGETKGAPQVSVKIQVEKDNAYLDDDRQNPYEVLRNTGTGVVLVQPYAEPSQYGQGAMVGFFGFAIDKTTLNMSRGGLMEGYEVGVQHGRCVK